MVEVRLTNDQRLWLVDITEDDDEWLVGTNTRGRPILLRRDLVKGIQGE
jgi:hypothetical protein